MRDISIVAGGWSVRDVALDRIPGFIVAVNDSAIHLPRCDAVVSMDRLWTEWRWPRLRDMSPIMLWLRRSAVQNIAERPPHLAVFECDHESDELTESAARLNGGSSGMCALNLAYVLRPARILLFGFDMRRSPKGEAYWHKPYPWAAKGATSDGKYRSWALRFARAAAQCKAAGIDVLNVSPASAIADFRRVSPAEMSCAR